MNHKSPAKLLRNARRITKFLEKKQNAPVNIKSKLFQPTLKSTSVPELTRSSTVVTNFPEPCPTCHFNQCELETSPLELLILKIFISNLHHLPSNIVAKVSVPHVKNIVQPGICRGGKRWYKRGYVTEHDLV